MAVQTVYNSIGAKRDVLAKVLDYAAAGEHAPTPAPVIVRTPNRPERGGASTSTPSRRWAPSASEPRRTPSAASTSRRSISPTRSASGSNLTRSPLARSRSTRSSSASDREDDMDANEIIRLPDPRESVRAELRGTRRRPAAARLLVGPLTGWSFPHRAEGRSSWSATPYPGSSTSRSTAEWPTPTSTGQTGCRTGELRLRQYGHVGLRRPPCRTAREARPRAAPERRGRRRPGTTD